MPLFDYTSVTAETVTRTVDEAIRAAEEELAAVIAVPGARSYRDTIAPLDRIGVITSDADGEGPFMARVHPDPAVRAAAVAAEEKLRKWSSDLVFRDDLYEAISAYARTDDAAALTGTEQRSLDFWLRDLRRAGHNLDPDQRGELRRLKQRLVELQVTFSRNADELRSGIDVDRAGLAGLPPSYVERLEPGTSEGSFRVTTDYPEYIPFMQEAVDRDLRRRLQRAAWNRAAEENTPLLEEAVEVRREMAALLGYDTWADYAMELKMADPKAVGDFYGSIIPGLTVEAESDRAGLQEMLDADHPGEALATWDWMYYDTQQRKRDHGIDETEVAGYFPLDQTVAAMFAVTGEVFGLDYRRVDEARAWHEDVALYEIRDADRDEAIAYFYADLFPREGKFTHAACWDLRNGMRLEDGSYRKPVAAVVANFTKPTASAPSLLKHDEVVTLFHEFGHVLHACLTEVDHPRFAGYDTEWDFVEAPSQILEHWTWEPDVLSRFAKHHESGEPIPVDLVSRLVEARDQNEALKTLRQVFLGQLDLDLHTSVGRIDAVDAYRRAHEYTLLPFHEGTNFVATFGHLMGGYDAGYYGYLWSKVYGDDMFSVFQAEGVLDPTVGMRYRREILAAGGARDAIESLRAFLGRDPSSAAFLERLGLAD